MLRHAIRRAMSSQGVNVHGFVHVARFAAWRGRAGSAPLRTMHCDSGCRAVARRATWRRCGIARHASRWCFALGGHS